ncbi:uncharacterized protein TRIVIDRAFT_111995 [Trichoderma virens Gv29-8]|uniref:Cyanovirin-N domain-containing protein n=1 Tax=Hypocrea virens (strain Gv29-8 / FGSC 10586) TaxID=413071 RepID=G9MUU9_HYPVG|nr:uncharacterized protein TRIVIDRAFT_111995 [Trichoderma virens Gv29-8]EHK21764.1 hypothetical protein TRIVIDRAFT_111995 [Trichoderma virens Gv29-8]UKZ76861.1 hypothetical protein TrVFT333_004576 [Trichoderma virens FT-333]
MKPSTIFISAISYVSLASSAAIANPDDSLNALEKRSCFKTGASYGAEKAAANKAALTACSGALTGTYSKRETRVKCYPIGNNKVVMLTIGLTGKNAPSSRTIYSQECFDGLSKEIECSKGGDTTYGNWRYRADPNEGSC